MSFFRIFTHTGHMLSLSVFSNSIKQDNEDIRCFSVTYRHSYVGTFSHPIFVPISSMYSFPKDIPSIVTMKKRSFQEKPQDRPELFGLRRGWILIHVQGHSASDRRNYPQGSVILRSVHTGNESRASPVTPRTFEIEIFPLPPVTLKRLAL